jgi:hypothetical protein
MLHHIQKCTHFREGNPVAFFKAGPDCGDGQLINLPFKMYSVPIPISNLVLLPALLPGS